MAGTVLVWFVDETAAVAADVAADADARTHVDPLRVTPLTEIPKRPKTGKPRRICLEWYGTARI